MKNFLINNWFKLSLVLIALFVAGVYSYNLMISSPRQDLYKKTSLDMCLKSSLSTYFDTWSSACVNAGKAKDCTSLPIKTAEGIEQQKKRQDDMCFEKFKLNAF